MTLASDYVSYDAVTDLKVKYLVATLRADGKVDSLSFERDLNALPRLPAPDFHLREKVEALAKDYEVQGDSIEWDSGLGMGPEIARRLLESLKPQHAEVFQSSAGNEGHAKPGQEPASTGGNGNPAPNAEDNPGREGG